MSEEGSNRCNEQEAESAKKRTKIGSAEESKIAIMRNASLHGMKYAVGGGTDLREPDRLEIRDAADGTVIRAFVGHTDYVRCLCISSDGNRLASGSSDASIRLWDINTGTQLLTMRGHRSTV